MWKTVHPALVVKKEPRPSSLAVEVLAKVSSFVELSPTLLRQMQHVVNETQQLLQRATQYQQQQVDQTSLIPAPGSASDSSELLEPILQKIDADANTTQLLLQKIVSTINLVGTQLEEVSQYLLWLIVVVVFY